MVIFTDIWEEGQPATKGGWNHELVIQCFSDVLGQPFEVEGLDRDDVWVRYKVPAAGEVINSNLILDFGRDAGNGDWKPTSARAADYVAFTFACQLWLDYPTPLEIKAHVDAGFAALQARMAAEEGGMAEDKLESGRRKIYFEREGLFDLSADPDEVKGAARTWAEVALADVTVAAQTIIYSD
jgi:hypothetical protein